jgi:hypothetical protein
MSGAQEIEDCLAALGNLVGFYRKEPVIIWFENGVTLRDADGFMLAGGVDRAADAINQILEREPAKPGVAWKPLTAS